MLVGPHGAALPHFPSTAVFGGFPLIRRPNRCDDGRPGADSVPEAPGNFAPPETGINGLFRPNGLFSAQSV